MTNSTSHTHEVPFPHALSRLLKIGTSLLIFAFLSGCSEKHILFHMKGPVGEQEMNLLITVVLLMLIVVIPVIVLTLYFAWRYRANNPKKVGYAPRWVDSYAIETVVWGIPILIVLVLAVITWQSTHALDPYKPLKVNGEAVPQMKVQVVAMNWKWLFIYPNQGVAVLNQTAFPINQPVAFNISSNATMNSFFIPQLGGQIYAMAGMRTQLHLLANEPGTYMGISANYSGSGFADMTFQAIAKPTEAAFQSWVAKVKQSDKVLNWKTFQKMADHGESEIIPGKAVIEEGKSVKEVMQKVYPNGHAPIVYFGSIEPGIFKRIMGQYRYGEMQHTRHAENHSKAASDESSAPEMKGDHE